MKQVEGYVERITYRNEDNGYSVIYLSNPEPKADEDDEVCCVGYFSFVSEGEYMQYFSDTLNQEYSKIITDNGGTGLAQQLYDSLKGTYNIK